MSDKLKVEKVDGDIETLRAIPYKNHMIYIVRIKKLHIFQWLISFKNEVYMGYMVIKPSKGKRKLTEQELGTATQTTLSGAETTIDILLGDVIEKDEMDIAKRFIEFTENND